MRGQYGKLDYAQMYKQAEKKDVPLALVIVAGVAIWVLIFGSVVGFAVLSPCSFTKTLVGADTFAKFQDPSIRTPPCDPAKDTSCVVWKLSTSQQCGCFLRYTVMGNSQCLDTAQ